MKPMEMNEITDKAIDYMEELLSELESILDGLRDDKKRQENGK